MSELIGVEAPTFKMPEQIGAAAVNGTDPAEDQVLQGTTKWYNVAKGWGFITPTDATIPDVFVHQSTIHKTGFRSLGDNEEVEFTVKRSEKGWEATKVTAVGGGEVQGSARNPQGRRRQRRFRCFNCSQEGDHLARRCPLGPQPKRCHHCRSEEHLVADCPDRPGPSGARAARAPAEPNGNQSPPIASPAEERPSAPAEE